MSFPRAAGLSQAGGRPDPVRDALDTAQRVDANLERIASLMGPDKAARALEEAVESVERRAAEKAARVEGLG